MRNVCKFATLAIAMFAISTFGFSQSAVRPKQQVTTQNLVRGVFGPVGSDSSWANYSVFNIIPGSALFPITSTTTVFSLGFTAGTEADISNMVVYTTARGSLTITAVTPVKLGGASNPSIHLSSTSVCPTAPSAATPCIVKLDSATLTLSPANDYYLTIFFTNNSNNSSIAATQPSGAQSSLSCFFIGGTDETQLKVGQAIPGTGNREPNFLMYVTNN
jgi:hypothetical protein